MSLAWGDVRDVALSLEGQAASEKDARYEHLLRSAASRHYYAVYHRVDGHLDQTTLRNMRRRQDDGGEGMGSHQAVIELLRRQGHESLAAKMDRLRKGRVEADYHDSLGVDVHRWYTAKFKKVLGEIDTILDGMGW